MLLYYPEFLTGDIRFIKQNYDCCYIFSLGISTEQNHIQQGRNSWVFFFFLPRRLRFYTSSSYETNIMENKRWALGVLHKSLVASNAKNVACKISQWMSFIHWVCLSSDRRIQTNAARGNQPYKALSNVPNSFIYHHVRTWSFGVSAPSPACVTEVYVVSITE